MNGGQAAPEFLKTLMLAPEFLQTLLLATSKGGNISKCSIFVFFKIFERGSSGPNILKTYRRQPNLTIWPSCSPIGGRGVGGSGRGESFWDGLGVEFEAGKRVCELGHQSEIIRPRENTPLPVKSFARPRGVACQMACRPPFPKGLFFKPFRIPSWTFEL